MFRIAISAHEKTGQINELLDFLDKSAEVLPQRRAFYINYKIVQFSLEHQTSFEKVRMPLHSANQSTRKTNTFPWMMLSPSAIDLIHPLLNQ